MERLLNLWYSRWRGTLIAAVLVAGGGMTLLFIGGGTNAVVSDANMDTAASDRSGTAVSEAGEAPANGSTATSSSLPVVIESTKVFEFANGATSAVQGVAVEAVVYELGEVAAKTATTLARALGVTGVLETSGTGAEREYRIEAVVLKQDGTWFFPSGTNNNSPVAAPVPKGVSVTDADAVAAAARLASSTGVQVGAPTVTKTANVVSVSMPLMWEGMNVGRNFTVSYGPGMQLVKGSGSVASYVQVDGWEPLSVREAAVRLETDPRVEQLANGGKLTVTSVTITTVDVVQSSVKHYLVPAYVLNTNNGVWVVPAAEAASLPQGAPASSSDVATTSVGTLPGR
jgi:hypothetical protein